MKIRDSFWTASDLMASNLQGIININRKSALKTADIPLGGSLIFFSWSSDTKVINVVLTHPV